MYDYLKNLLPRVRQYSKDLDVQELFNDKHWVYVDNKGKRTTYIFERDETLIVSVSGQPKTGTWKYIPAAKSLLLKLDDQSAAFLSFSFYHDALFILKKDDDEETPWVLINKNIIPDLDVRAFLNSLLPEAERPDLDVKLEMENGMTLSVKGIKRLLLNYEGFLVLENRNQVSDGLYEMRNSQIFIEIKSSKIDKYFLKKTYKVENDELILFLGDPHAPQINDRAFLKNNKITKGKFKLHGNEYNIRTIRVKNGKIEKISMEPDRYLLIFMIIVYGSMFCGILYAILDNISFN